MKLNEDIRLSLVVAVLASYSFPLERAWNLREKIRSVGLHHPENILGKDVAIVGNLLKSADYDRGGITYIIAPRLIALMEDVRSGALDALTDSINMRSEDCFCASLTRVGGIGPKTAHIAWMLING